MKSSFAEHYSSVIKGIEESCSRVGRSLDSVKILAATKGRDIETIKEAINQGIKICGENYLQDALPKVRELRDLAEWHFIGHLQSNKVKKVVENFDCIQSVDSLKLAKKINDSVISKYPIYLEVNIGDEESKFGLDIENVQELKNGILELSNLDIKGLFCMAPHIPPNQTRPYFKEMKALSDKLGLEEISMGMSNDYKIAIEEGSTMIRIGSALFND